MDETYTPKPIERKVLFGMTLEQKRNDGKINEDLFTNIVTKRQDVSELSFSTLSILLKLVTELSKCINKCKIL